MNETIGRAKSSDLPRLVLLWTLLPLLIVAALAIYYPCARQNLPVALNVDDRTSLGVLLRFHQGSANPKFFMYPTLYFYLTYALTAGFGFSRMLLAGHLLNLGLLGVTAWLSALFCIRQFQSKLAAVVAACCVLLSPTMAASGAYLCTDVLLAATTIFSLDCFMQYFRSRNYQDWLCAMLAVGCAIAAKYTAAILFIAYAAGEFICLYRNRSHHERIGLAEKWPRFSRETIYASLLALGGMGALTAAFFPMEAILHFVAMHRTNLDTRSSIDYVVFLNRLRRLVVELSVGASLLLVAVWRSQVMYEFLALKRLYYGLLIIVGVFLLTTPYSLLDPTKFVYDLGALLRANVVVVGNHQQWSEYWHWLFFTENHVLVLLGIFGLGLMVYRLLWVSLTPMLFLALHIFAICTAHRGFPRYLNPVLPLLYCATGLLVAEAWRGTARIRGTNSALLTRLAVCVAAAVVVWQMIRRTVEVDRAAAQHTAYYASYEEVLNYARHSNAASSQSLNLDGVRVLYAGFAPSIELGLAGFRTQEVSWASLERGPIGEQLDCGDLLILNERSATTNHVTAREDGSLQVLLDDPRGEGQMVVRRRDCRGLDNSVPPSSQSSLRWQMPRDMKDNRINDF